MMSVCKSSFISLLILLIVLICCLTVAGAPLYSTATNTDNLDPSVISRSNDVTKTKSQITMKDINGERYDRPKINGSNSGSVQKRSSEVIVDTEPQCILHHEYAEILGSQDAGRDPRFRFFVNRNNEIRYYICLPCQVCPPGVQILFPCHVKRDTICSTNCINPEQIFDAVSGMCVYPTWPKELPVATTQTSNSTSIRPSRRAITTVNLPQIFQPDNNNGGIDTDIRLHYTTISSHHKSLYSQVTVITVGVLSLNVVVVFGVVLLLKRKKCKLLHLKSDSRCVNNALSSHCDTPAITPQTGTVASVRNLMDNETNRLITTDVDETCEIHTVYSDGIQSTEVLDRPTLNAPQIPTHRAKESNLNIFFEPGYEQGAEKLSSKPTDVNGSVQVLSGIDPYSLVMIGHFGPNGGILSCDDSDVILEIPPGAIPADRSNQLVIARVSLRPDVLGPKPTDLDSVWLTPLVEFESPGLERFDKDVRIRLPHCARMQPGWTFRVDYTKSLQHPSSPSPVTPNFTCPTNPLVDNITTKPDSWFSVEQKYILNKSGTCQKTSSKAAEDVTFEVDDQYFNILTSHFSKYCCSGCHKDHPLHLEAVVYWNYTKVTGREQMDLNVYVLDAIKDSRLKVAENEKSGINQTGYFPLILTYKKKCKESFSIEICIKEDSMGDDWRWRLDTYNGCLPLKRVIQIQSLIRCCSPLLPSRQTFSFCPKMPSSTEPLTYFQAMVSIKQQNWPESQCIPILVTVPLTKAMELPLVTGKDSKNAGMVVTDADIDVVVNKLSVKNWRDLYRKLMGSSADVGIDHIQAREPHNTREQIHSALVSWRRSKGQLATVEELVEALDAIGERAIAESLEGDYGRQNESEIIVHNVNTICKETRL